MRFIGSVFGASVAVAVIALTVPAGAENVGAFSKLAGSWSGSGRIQLEGGRTENLRCRASYTDHNGGNGIGISLRCASASNRVDLHARLTANGSRVSGDWEEREFNAGGNATGTASGNQISLSIQGGGLAGSMSVITNGTRQDVSITTENIALKGIQIALARD